MIDLQKFQQDKLEIIGIKVTLTKLVRLLSVEINKNLDFNIHTSDICKIVSNKNNVLIRIRNYLDKNKAYKICQAYILSQFNYRIGINFCGYRFL